jgi:hypothetical protein
MVEELSKRSKPTAWWRLTCEKLLIGPVNDICYKESGEDWKGPEMWTVLWVRELFYGSPIPIVLLPE